MTDVGVAGTRTGATAVARGVTAEVGCAGRAVRVASPPPDPGVARLAGVPGGDVAIARAVAVTSPGDATPWSRDDGWISNSQATKSTVQTTRMPINARSKVRRVIPYPFISCPVVRSISRAAVFRAWTEPDSLAQWWWPARFGTVYEVDLRVGGRYRFKTVDVPSIGVLDVGGVFLAIHAPERLVYTWRWAGERTETRITVDFHDHGERTEVVLAHQGFPDAEGRDNHAMGWTDCLDRLDVLIQSDARPG